MQVMAKIPKKPCGFRLSEETIQQIKDLADQWSCSDSDAVASAVGLAHGQVSGVYNAPLDEPQTERKTKPSIAVPDLSELPTEQATSELRNLVPTVELKSPWKNIGMVYNRETGERIEMEQHYKTYATRPVEGGRVEYEGCT